jgi:pyruvate ferredoxin oxidoreductase alpha subunit
MAKSTVAKKQEHKIAAQKVALKSGNMIAAFAAKQINFHIMGYYPITPSTQIAEELDAMKAEGLHDIVMIPGDGEHGAAGICYGAATAGARVLNATSANGLMFSLEQLPVQSGTRYPMVLNIACRSISGPLDIRGDQSDVMTALNTGWVILFAKDPQAVYDFNIMAVKIGEHLDVRLPVMVAFDGFFTSHQERRVHVFAEDRTVRDFLGPQPVVNSSVDPRHPLTIGPYMNDPDLINNKKQLAMAFENAYHKVIPQVMEEFGELSGRRYDYLETYRMEDAEAALFIVGSAFDTSKIAVDRLRDKGFKVGTVAPNVIRPFPADQIRRVFKEVKALTVCDRQDSYGAWGGNMTLEVKAALKDDPSNTTLVQSRIYGIGGKDFYVEDALKIFEETITVAETGKVEKAYEYHGANPGTGDHAPRTVYEPLTKEEQERNHIEVVKDEATGKLKVKGVAPRKLTEQTKRIAPGHGACPGCGIFPNIGQFLKGIKGDVVMLYHTGCAMVVTTGYPFTSHKITYIHNLFQNGAPTLSGVLEAFKERQRRGEIPDSEDITFIMITGDGGQDIGMGPTIGAALRNHNLIILEYDNEGYMNTGHQLSFTTPLGHATATSHYGKKQIGKMTHHKDTIQIMAGTHIPYLFTGAESHYMDLVKKAAKAQYYAKHEGLVYGKVLSACPLSWRADDRLGAKIVEAAVNSNFFPLYEIEKGITTITYNPEEKGKKVPITEFLKMMGKTRHLLKPEMKEVVARIEAEVDRRWKRLLAMHEHELL